MVVRKQKRCILQDTFLLFLQYCKWVSLFQNNQTNEEKDDLYCMTRFTDHRADNVSSYKQKRHMSMHNVALIANWRPTVVPLALHFQHKVYPADVYLFKVNNENTRTMCKICLR